MCLTCIIIIVVASYLVLLYKLLLIATDTASQELYLASHNFNS